MLCTRQGFQCRFTLLYLIIKSFQQPHEEMKAEKFSALIESALDKKNHDKEWKEHKFELVEEKYREDLDCVQAIMKNWESHLREMIRFAESLEAEKENDYAGN